VTRPLAESSVFCDTI